MRHFSIAAILVIFAGVATPALADERDDALAALQACRSIAADTVRLACLDAATQLLDTLEATDKAPEEPAAPIIATPAPPPPVAQPAEPPAVSQADIEALEREREALAAEREALARERAELDRRQAEQDRRAAEVAGKEAERLAAEREALARERAALEAARIENERATEENTRRLSYSLFGNNPKEIVVTIERITRNQERIHRFYTSDGEVVKQSDKGQFFRPPSSLPAQATIRRSASGSKWIVFDEHPKRRLKVKVVN